MKWFVKCLRHYADFRGRASMPEFWYFVLGLFLVLFLLLAVILGVSSFCTVGATSRRYVVCLVGLPFVMPYLAVMVRRLHDSGRSGWWAGGYLAVSIAGRALPFCRGCILFSCFTGGAGPVCRAKINTAPIRRRNKMAEIFCTQCVRAGYSGRTAFIYPFFMIRFVAFV